MTKPNFTQSQKRFQESLGSLFNQEKLSERKCLILTSPTDIGVIRNGGRNGARFAPQSFLSTFKRFAVSETLKNYSFITITVSDEEEEKKDFHHSQKVESKKIDEALERFAESRVVHIGGGHDHVYPLLVSLGKKYKKVIVLNIDAHADTRTDETYHSGTPFRQFANEFQGDFKIYQIGLHPFANSFSTLSPLARGTSETIWKKDSDHESYKRLFEQLAGEINSETAVIFSLDADALSGHEVPGVSAVNPAGFSREELIRLWDYYARLPLSHQTILGIYELNPLYDSLASLSMRTMGSFVYETL